MVAGKIAGMQLPVEAVIADLINALTESDSAVLEAPPGAGKTTRVPLALLESGVAASGKILMLEPRRLAVKAAAERMAHTLGESVGERVGFRIRGESKVSSRTRIEVITEGVLTRMLQTDPGLEQTTVVIFDEYHERNIDSDLGLALTLYGRELFRESRDPLKLLVMSATLDGAAVAQLLGDAPVISSKGRSHEVEIIHGNAPAAGTAIEPLMVSTIKEAVESQQGSILAFLPGKREITRTQKLLTEHFNPSNPDAPLVLPLHGDMKLADQRVAVAPCKPGARKIVLATSIAETSLTIDGVRVVVDSGLSRLPEFDPKTAMTRLVTRRVSRASSVQRAGRAGRTEPGVCYRLWSHDQHNSLVKYTAPQITQADLAPVALSLYQFGVVDPDELSWLDPPPAGAYSQALSLLESLNALQKVSSGNELPRYVLTKHGEIMASLPVHPRLAHMLIFACRYGLLTLASQLAALLSSRDIVRDAGADINQRIDLLESGNVPAQYRHTVREIKLQAAQYAKICMDYKRNETELTQCGADQALGMLVACAYPDRVARKRGNGEYQLANGRMVRLRGDDPLGQNEWLAVAHVGGVSSNTTDNAYLAADINPVLFDDELATLVHSSNRVEWAAGSAALLSERQWCIGKIVLRAEPLNDALSPERSRAVAAFIRKKGLKILPWTDQLMALRHRIAFLRMADNKAAGESRADSVQWPDLSDEGLLAGIEEWLLPWLDNVSHVNHFAKIDLKAVIDVLLPWELRRQMDKLAPVSYTVPSGSKINLDYSQFPPVLGVKLQEMLGCTIHPSINNGTLLKVALLSPARRPIQVTQDIAGFWRGSYEEIKKEMRGRYPKHNWPDDPTAAMASVRTTKKKKL